MFSIIESCLLLIPPSDFEWILSCYYCKLNQYLFQRWLGCLQVLICYVDMVLCLMRILLYVLYRFFLDLEVAKQFSANEWVLLPNYQIDFSMVINFFAAYAIPLSSLYLSMSFFLLFLLQNCWAWAGVPLRATSFRDLVVPNLRLVIYLH